MTVQGSHNRVQLRSAEEVGRRSMRERLTSSPRAPEVVLMDIRMPVFDGIEATAQLRQAAETIAVLVLTTFGEDEVLWGALEAGAASATERRRSCSLTTTVSSRPGRQTRRVARGRGARQRQVDHLEPAGGGAHAASSATSPAAPGARAAQAIGLLTFFPLYLLGGGGPPKGAMYGVMHTISNALPSAIPAIADPSFGLSGFGTQLAALTLWSLAAIAAIYRLSRHRAG